MLCTAQHRKMAHAGIGTDELIARCAEKYQLVVWDFDETVLQIHAFGLRVAVEDVKARILEDDFADLGQFKRIASGLAAAGVKVAIASFGKAEVITEYLKLGLGDENPFTSATISTPASVGYADGVAIPDGKNPQLQQIFKELGVDAHRTLFFDDSKQNIRKAKDLGVVAYHCARPFNLDAFRDAIVNGGSTV